MRHLFVYHDLSTRNLYPIPPKRSQKLGSPGCVFLEKDFMVSLYLKGKWIVRLKWQFQSVFQDKKAKFLMRCFEAQICLDGVLRSFKGLTRTSPPATSDGRIKHCNYDQRPPTSAYVITHFPAPESHFVPLKRRWERDTSDVYLLVSQGFGDDTY